MCAAPAGFWLLLIADVLKLVAIVTIFLLMCLLLVLFLLVAVVVAVVAAVVVAAVVVVAVAAAVKHFCSLHKKSNETVTLKQCNSEPAS